MINILETSHNNIDVSDSMIIRGIAILMVICYHYSQTIYAVHPIILRLGLGALACSIFFFISGYAFDASLRKMKQIDFKILIQKKLIRLYFPLLISNIFCCILLTADLLPHQTFDGSLDYIDIGSYISGLSIINPYDWFLRMLILLTILSTISIKLNISPIWLCVISGLLYSIYMGSVTSLSWISFVAGYIYSRFQIRMPHHALAIVFVMSFIIFFKFRYINTIALLLNFLTVVLTVNIIVYYVKYIPFKRMFRFIGSISLELYLMHTIVIMIGTQLTYSLIIKTIIFATLSILLTVVFSKILAYTNSKLTLKGINGTVQ